MMFNQEQAKEFLDRLFKTIFENGEIECINDFYTPDVVGHFKQQTFGIEKIGRRVRLLDEFCREKMRFEILDHYVIDNFLIFSCRQVWLTPKDGRLCEAMVFGTYRIQDNRIKEAWIITESAEDSYEEVNEKFDEFLRQYELTAFGKKAFFQYMSDYEYFYNKEKVDLTKREQETLFYYLRGYSAKEIAREINISHRTVESYIAAIMQKAGVTCKAELRLKLFPEK
jgi:DNA-binding CsgD family transcriptional regulator/predicted SnoaL-like aldol condensation-catalyzing enzyme